MNRRDALRWVAGYIISVVHQSSMENSTPRCLRDDHSMTRHDGGLCCSLPNVKYESSAYQQTMEVPT